MYMLLLLSAFMYIMLNAIYDIHERYAIFIYCTAYKRSSVGYFILSISSNCTRNDLFLVSIIELRLWFTDILVCIPIRH